MEKRIKEAILNGLLTAKTTRSWGCARIYVCLKTKDRKILNAFKKGCALAGVRYLKEAYGTAGKAAYIGYDNATGKEYAMGEKVAKNLNAIGVPVYSDAVEN